VRNLGTNITGQQHLPNLWSGNSKLHIIQTSFCQQHDMLQCVVVCSWSCIYLMMVIK